MSRKICVITGSRAEYGHLRWLIRDLDEDLRVDVQLLVTGMHLEKRFGFTYREIEADGQRIDAKVPMSETDDRATGIAASMAQGLSGITCALQNLQPDLVVILGDRFEMMAAAQAAMLTRTPIAHLHGGETTEGAMDEAIRHSITKTAHLHFTAAAPYARRVAQLGEPPHRIFNVGAPGLDFIERETLLDREALSTSIEMDLSGPYFLVTYHPVTLSEADPGSEVEAILEALAAYSDHKILITGVNADTGNSRIEQVYRAIAEHHPQRIRVVEHLGQHRYVSALQHCCACVGNSSSGLIEAPALGVPTVNIGPRQQGRLRAATVIDCAPEATVIAEALERALDPSFRAKASATPPPYGQGGASQRIKEVLATADLDGILIKHFHDWTGSPRDGEVWNGEF